MADYTIDEAASRFLWHAKATMHSLKAESRGVRGTVSVDPANASGGISGEVGFAVRSFKAEEPDADPKVAEWTEAERYPDVKVQLLEAREMKKRGATHEVTVQVDFHGCRKQFRVPVNVSAAADVLRVDGEYEFKLTDFGIKPPTFLVVVRAKDYLKAEWHLTLKAR